MPIEGRTVLAASKAFCDYLNRVLSTTVTETRLVAFGPKKTKRISVSFRERGRPSSALLSTRYGPVTLYIGQLCEGIPTADRRRQRLITVEYEYNLTVGDRDEWGTKEPLLRWEYVRDRTGQWCRHHLQGTVPLRFGRAGEVSINDLHLPTGYVTIEEIVRFCIVDLGVAPRSDNWSDILDASYKRFRDEFVAVPR